MPERRELSPAPDRCCNCIDWVVGQYDLHRVMERFGWSTGGNHTDPLPISGICRNRRGAAWVEAELSTWWSRGADFCYNLIMTLNLLRQRNRLTNHNSIATVFKTVPPNPACHNCQTTCRKFGKHRNGLQRYRCSQCRHTFTEDHVKPARRDAPPDGEGRSDSQAASRRMQHSVNRTNHTGSPRYDHTPVASRW